MTQSDSPFGESCVLCYNRLLLQISWLCVVHDSTRVLRIGDRWRRPHQDHPIDLTRVTPSNEKKV